MISAVSSSCLHTNFGVKTRIALTVIECVAFTSIAAVLVSLYGLTTYGYIGIGVSGGLILLDLGLLGASTCCRSSSDTSGGLFGFSPRREPQVHFLGGSHVPKDRAWEKGTSLFNEYFYEAIPLDIDGKEVHVYFKVLAPYVQTWKEHYASKMTFQEYIYQLIEERPAVKEEFLRYNVRYFNDDERKQTCVKWIGGKPQQIGLDSKDSDLKEILPGKYAFVLGQKHLYMGVKERPKIGHSSFLRGCATNSSGFITLNEKGEIAKVVFYSGHYRPKEKEAQAFYNYLRKNLTPIQFSQIEFYIMQLPGEKGVREKREVLWTPSK